MSRLNELIAELCPDGVEYKALGEVFEKRNGYTPSKSNSSYWEGGSIPWFRMEDIRANGTVLDDAIQHVTEAAVKKGGVFPANSIIVATSATIGAHALIKCDFLCNQRFTCLTLREEFSGLFDLGFLNHYFVVLDEYCLANVNQGSFASVKMGAFNKFHIPVPPIEVQREVVRVLDEYTAAHDEMVEQLNEEAYLHEQQLSGVRNELLGNRLAELCPDGVEYRQVGKVVTIRNGSDHKHLGDGNIPVYGSGGIMRYADAASYTEPSVLLPRKGSVGNVFYVEEPFWNVDTVFYTVIDTSIMDPKYFYHLMVHANLAQYSTSAARPSLTQKTLNRIRIPVPPIEVQREVVRILDEYTAAHDVLLESIAEERQLATEQLALVRNQLLSFPEKVA